MWDTKFMKILAYLALLNFLTQVVSATVISDSRGSISLDFSKSWKYEKNLLGLPHVLLTNDSPERSSLSITLTGLENVQLPSKTLKKNQDQYKDGRLSWAKGRHAEIEEFLPYLETKTSDNKSIHSIGFKYKLGNQMYFEKSFYIECPKSLVHLKLLTPKDSPRILEGESIVKTLRCDF